jgi:hypothetical protein
MSRKVLRHYQDPLDLIWIAAAGRMDLRVKRSRDSYASTDGHGDLTISASSEMDEDDCLAQMIFHEICHSLVQGPQSFGWIDWGLDNETEKDREREHACLRLQAALLEPLGLRQVLAPTTDFREYYDALPRDPFGERHEGERLSIVLSRAAYHRRNQLPWKEHLQTALESTTELLQSTRSYLSSDANDQDLVSQIEERVPSHPTGLEGFRGTPPPAENALGRSKEVRAKKFFAVVLLVEPGWGPARTAALTSNDPSIALIVERAAEKPTIPSKSLREIQR